MPAGIEYMPGNPTDDGISPRFGSQLETDDATKLQGLLAAMKDELRAEVVASVRAELAGKLPPAPPLPPPPSVPELDAEAVADEGAPQDIGELTIVMVCVYYMAKMDRVLADTAAGRTPEANVRLTHLTTFAWVIVTICVALAEISFLASLGIAQNWKRCTTLGECPLGQECVHIIGASTLQRPLCNDCHYLVDTSVSWGSADGPWGHMLPGEVEGNVSTLCVEQLLSPENARFHGGDKASPGFGSCLYARQAGEMMSVLDRSILLLIFLLVGIEAYADAHEQGVSMHLRRLVAPSRIPSCNFDSWCRWFCLLLIKVLEQLYSRAVPALVPFAVLSLMVTQGTGSCDIILNGLSIIFVLELDSHVPDIFLDAVQHEEIKEWLSAVYRRSLSSHIAPYESTSAAAAAAAAAQSANANAKPTATGTNGIGFVQRAREPVWRRRARRRVRMLCHPSQQGVAGIVMCLVMLVVGFGRTTGLDSGITCEQIHLYFFYKIAIHLGLWWKGLLLCACDLVTTITNACKRPPDDEPTRRGDPPGILSDANAGGADLSDGGSQCRRWMRLLGYFALERGMRPFVETLITSIAMCTIFHFGSAFYWRTASWYAVQTYWGSLKDVFGFCGIGGLGDAWGYECIVGW